MENIIKLTVRLPATLHSRLRRRAMESNLSLNQTIIEVVQRGLDSEPFGEILSGRERLLKVLEESGLYEPLGPGWDKYIKNASEISIDELWAETKGMPPLSEDIIADRGER
jgi:hypothetical protein